MGTKINKKRGKFIFIFFRIATYKVKRMLTTDEHLRYNMKKRGYFLNLKVYVTGS